MMIRLVALTGSIGAGKSTIARLFAELGARIIDADRLSREIVDPSTSIGAAVLDRIVDRFGPTMLTTDGELARDRIASAIFADPTVRDDYNAVIHPALLEATVAAISAERARGADSGIIVHEIPLLTRDSAKLPWTYDFVVTVEAPVGLRLDRLTAERGYTREHARDRIAAQGTEESRTSIADAVIRTNSDIADTRVQVDALWRRWTDAEH